MNVLVPLAVCAVVAYMVNTSVDESSPGPATAGLVELVDATDLSPEDWTDVQTAIVALQADVDQALL